MNSRESERRWAFLDEVKARVMQRLGGRAPLHDVYLLPHTKDIEVYVFYHADADIERCNGSGISKEISDAFVEELNRVGRGPASGTGIRFEFDSDENVQKNYRGNYFFRLR